ncbi:hypothetical protein FRB90_010737 [Tulasnella sp. 427]|nr:hypothetical protein FRB90_010737 [Tulasnella sp. 427]
MKTPLTGPPPAYAALDPQADDVLGGLDFNAGDTSPQALARSSSPQAAQHILVQDTDEEDTDDANNSGREGRPMHRVFESSEPEEEDHQSDKDSSFNEVQEGYGGTQTGESEGREFEIAEDLTLHVVVTSVVMACRSGQTNNTYKSDLRD